MDPDEKAKIINITREKYPNAELVEMQLANNSFKLIEVHLSK